MKRNICLALFLCTLLLSAGCGVSDGVPDTERETVSIALWSDQLTENYGQYLQAAFPEVDFEFYTATNSTDFYRFKEQSGDLPDILTVRRFSLNDVADWKDSLLDLSGSELASTFDQPYLRNYTYSDGTVNWLPACAEIDGLLLNKALLEDNGLSIPRNDQEFWDLCAALKDLGIQPFRSNFNADYTCLEILQGLSIPQLTSQEGREWRQQYESGQTDQLSEEVWLPVFQRMMDFITVSGIGPAELEGDTAEMFDSYVSRETAVIRGTSAEAVNYGAADQSVMIPFPGKTEEDGWFLTYPAFQAAASARAGESPERKQLILEILEAMLSQEGLRRIDTSGNLVAYSKRIDLKLSPVLSHIEPYIDSNRLYIRLASSDMFTISRQVVQGMLTGDYPDAQSAFDAFNAALREEGGTDPAAAHVDTGYSYAFQPSGGSPAASAVMNSLREELDAELLVGQASNIAGSIRAGDYTEEELRFLTMGESIDILRCQVTGEQLYDYLGRVLSASGTRGSVINNSTLYVSSGFEMEIQKTEGGYTLERLTIGGVELDRNRTYDLAVLGNELLMHGSLLQAAGVQEYENTGRSFRQLITDRLLGGKPLAAPTDYITLR